MLARVHRARTDPAGMGYKVASVPFHMWAPDVYTGRADSDNDLPRVGSKAAGFALLTRFFYPGDLVADRGRQLAGADGRRLAASCCSSSA